MPVYDRSNPDDPEIVDEWAEGFGWLAHPEETGQRVGHAIRSDDGVWLIDPLDAPGIDARIDGLGPVVGVVVCSNWHARDAAVFASRYDVPVSVPSWLSRIDDLVDAPIERFEDGIGEFEATRIDPLPGWQEALLYRERDGSLYSPDVLSRENATAGERVGLTLPLRPFPPRDTLGDLEPDRILSGHGRGIASEATPALRTALDGSRVRFPRALATQAVPMTKAIVQAVRG